MASPQYALPPPDANTLARNGPSSKALLGVGLAVALAHGVILQGTSNALEASQRSVTRPFITRSIALNPVAQDAPGASALAPAAPPAPRVRKPVVASRTDNTPSPVLTSVSERNSMAAPVDEAQLASNTIADETANLPAMPASAPASAVDPVPVAGATQAPLPMAVPSALASGAPSIAYTLPGSTRLKYNVIGTKDNLNYNARAEMLWLQDGSTYEARLEVSAFIIGSRMRTSTGRLTAEGLLPTRFADKYRSEVAAHFERDKQKVTFSANTPDLPLLPGMQDQLSVFVQLGAMLAGEPAKYPAGTNISFETIGPRAGETWVITVDGEEKLNLPGGDLNAIKLTRKPRREYDQTAELWLAPALGYLPARIKITEKNGDFVDQVWRATEAP